VRISSLGSSKSSGIRVTIGTAPRTNEWNIRSAREHAARGKTVAFRQSLQGSVEPARRDRTPGGLLFNKSYPSK
jgi:hypothetical protein